MNRYEIQQDNANKFRVIRVENCQRRAWDNPPCESMDDAMAMIEELEREEKQYQIAFVDGSDGSFDIVEKFEAASDDAANAYAKENYDGQEWYVLHQGKNVNG